MVDVNEFEFLYEEEKTDEFYLSRTKEHIDAYKSFIEDDDRTYQGISIAELKKNITVEKTHLIPWEHVVFNIDFSNLANVGKYMTSDLIIPNFIEEVKSDYSGEEAIVLNNIAKTKIETVYIPKSVMIINANTFSCFKNMVKLEIAPYSTLMFIGTGAFDGCTKLKKIDLRNCEELDTEYISLDRLSNIDGIKLLV